MPGKLGRRAPHHVLVLCSLQMAPLVTHYSLARSDTRHLRQRRLQLRAGQRLGWTSVTWRGEGERKRKGERERGPPLLPSCAETRTQLKWAEADTGCRSAWLLVQESNAWWDPRAIAAPLTMPGSTRTGPSQAWISLPPRPRW